MNLDFNKLLIWLLGAAALVLFSMPFLPVEGGSVATGLIGDKFDTEIGRLDTLDGIEKAVPKYIRNTGNADRDYARALAEVVQLHTIHGISRQSWKENWIASLIDRFGIANSSFSGRMRPEDLIKDNVAYCSQVSLILQELFRRKGIEYATVRFNVGGPPPHSAVAARPDGVWRYYDASYEPVEQGVPFRQLIESNRFLNLYQDKSWDSSKIGKEFYDLAKQGKIKIIDINGRGPYRGILFQDITKFLSNYIWLVPFTMMMAIGLFSRRAANRGG